MPDHRIIGLSGDSDGYALAEEHSLRAFHNARGGFGLDGTYYALPSEGLESFFGDVGDFFTRVLKPITQVLPPQLRGLQPFKRPLDALKLVTLPVTLSPLIMANAARRNPAIAGPLAGIAAGIATANPAIGAAVAAGVGAATKPNPPPPVNYPVVDYGVGSVQGPGEIQGPPMAPVGGYAGPSIPGQLDGALVPTTYGGSALPKWGPTPPPVYSVADDAYQTRQIVTPGDLPPVPTAPRRRAPALPAWAPWAAAALGLYVIASRRPR